MDRSDDNIDVVVDPETVRTRPGAPPLPQRPERVPSRGQSQQQTFDVAAMARPVSPAITRPVSPAVPQPVSPATSHPTPPLRWPSTDRPVPLQLEIDPHPAATEIKTSYPALARKLGRVALLAMAGWLAVVLTLVVIYRFVAPPVSTLMLYERVTGQDVEQTWKPIEAISPNVVRAVLLSEDGRFCEHWGVDFDEMQNAIERAGDGMPRGASTISMQVTKNLFLWSSKSYVRKAIEIPLTFVIEALWPKRRIMEIYLNIAEWGPGIYGVEAASRYHFNKPAARLNEREAAQLAVALPNPILRDAGDPGPRTQRLAGDILSRMHTAPKSASQCVLGR